MAIKEIFEWFEADASNNFPSDPDGGWPENMLRSDVNQAARADMGAIRRFYNNTEWLNLTRSAAVTQQPLEVARVAGGDWTQYFVAGRRLKFYGGTPDPFYANVVSSIFGAGVTDVTVNNPSNGIGLPADVTTVDLHSTPSIGSLAWAAEGTLITVATLTGVALQDAINTARVGAGGLITLTPGAVYLIDATVNIPVGAAIVIDGQGATLQANGDILGVSLLSMTGGEGITLQNIRFDGQRASQTAGDDIGIVATTGGTTDVLIRNCEVTDSWGHGIHVAGQPVRWNIKDCHIWDIGQNGISIDDAASFVQGFFIRGCTIWQVAQRVSAHAAIKFAGIVSISGCNFPTISHPSFDQYGVWASEKLSISPSDESGRESSIVGCHFAGTAPNGIGVLIHGRDVSVSDCHFVMQGASAIGVDVMQPLGGSFSERNRVIGCSFRLGSFGVQYQATSESCVVADCAFVGINTAISLDGNRYRVSNCTIQGGVTGINMKSASNFGSVADCTIEGVSGNGVVVSGGAVDCAVVNFQFDNIGIANIVDSGTLTKIVLLEITGSDYDSLFTNEVVAMNWGSGPELDVNAPNIAVTSTVFNGVGEYYVTGQIEILTSSAAANIEIRMGQERASLPAKPATLIPDPSIGRSWAVAAGTPTTIHFGPLRCQPAANDEIYFAIIGAPGANRTMSFLGDTAAGTLTYMRLESV